jgi:hypothetical protein
METTRELLHLDKLRPTGTLTSPANCFLSQGWAPEVNTLKLVGWVQVLLGVGLREIVHSGSIRVSRLWKWSWMVGIADTVFATFYVNENIDTSL